MWVGPKWAMGAERFWPLPSIAIAEFRIHSWKAARVRGSKVRKISSSWTDWATFARESVPPSSSAGSELLPGVSSM